MQTALTSTTTTEYPVIAHLLQECSAELLRFCGEDAGVGGALLASLDSGRAAPSRDSLQIVADGWPVGAAVVEHRCVFDQGEGHTVGAFCIGRAWRRRGVGQAAAMQIFDLFRGRWEIATLAQNVPATAFWRAVVDRHTRGRYDERWLHKDSSHYIVQIFWS